MAPQDDSEARFIDSHAHLADPAFAGDRDDVADRARDAGAEAVVCIGSALERGAAADAAAARPGFVHWTSGIHPHEAGRFDPAVHPDVLRDDASRGAVALGECGLDYHYDNSPRDVQRRVLDAHLTLAAELRLPLVVHTRDAEDDTTAVIRAAGAAGVRGVLHCFTGSAALAEAALEAGWYISFSGIVTFRKWEGDDVIRLVPDERLLVESDSPYLAPVPFRGKRNEPAWVRHTIERIAGVRGVGAPALAAQTARNARAFFGLASAAAA